MTPTWIPFHGTWVLQAAAAGPAMLFGTGGGTLLGVRHRSMRCAPRLTPAGVHWAWTWGPPGPSAPVPEEWVIPSRQGPLAVPQEELHLEVKDLEVVVEVDGLSPQQKRVATALVCFVLHSVFIAAHHALFANMYLMWMALHRGQFARNLLLLRGTASCSCSLSTCFRASSSLPLRR